MNITVPASLRMGEAFVVRLSGARAGEATVRFPSEVGEDVRRPNEALKPVGAAGEYVVPGRVVLGKTTPVVYEVTLDGALVRGRIPVTGLDQPIQHLNLPPASAACCRTPPARPKTPWWKAPTRGAPRRPGAAPLPRP
ncbi:hypothetical protein [Deinococcus multiflagellatus]|uniref:Uncharacterized protein n=1 Tax=Deinococcus multiflagellatus TaxID=1656887 RepID=A0ABW1ZH56_9DEIO